jgi:hypothetical protein
LPHVKAADVDDTNANELFKELVTNFQINDLAKLDKLSEELFGAFPAIRLQY